LPCGLGGDAASGNRPAAGAEEVQRRLGKKREGHRVLSGRPRGEVPFVRTKGTRRESIALRGGGKIRGVRALAAGKGKEGIEKGTFPPRLGGGKRGRAHLPLLRGEKRGGILRGEGSIPRRGEEGGLVRRKVPFLSLFAKQGS